MLPKLYFAHPVNLFGTELKLWLMPKLTETFRGWEIEDPDQPHHQQGYAEWKKRLEGNTSKSGGMSYYYDVVLPHCHGCLFMPFLDGMLGRGVAGEAKFFAERGQQVFHLYPQYFDLPGSRLFWRTLNPHEHNLLIAEDPRFVLSIEETRARTWMSPEEYNKVKRPYETAHCIEFDKSKWTSEYLKSVAKK